MDAIFALPPGARARAMGRAAARLPGCLYLCLWAPAAISGLQPNHLFCLDAWIGGGDRALELFEAYRGALCAAVSGCVPGWAYKEGAACMELPEHDLTASASLQVQQQFYRETGTKMAVFMGCECGEIEVGLSAASASAPAAAAVVSEVQQSILEELLQMPPPSSSSSSLLSLSVGSPEYSSLVRSMATSVGASAAAAAPSPRALPQQPSPLPSPMHGGLLAPVYGEFPDSDDAAMAQAMLAVVSTSAPPPWNPPRRRAHSRSWPHRATAFKAYNAALLPRARPRPGAPGQRMIKTGISLLASVYMEMRNQELTAARRGDTRATALPPPQPPPPPPSSSQLHHMISERRRRERMNDSFQTLRALLPPDSKKDKAAVLASTTEYMDKLISQVSELEEKNRQLEAQLVTHPGKPQQASIGGGSCESSSERVQVDMAITGSSTSASRPDQPREVSIRVTVRAECDVSDIVVALLARLREMGRFAVVSVYARQRSRSLSQVSLTLRVTVGDVFDETSLKEAVTKAVDGAVTTPPVVPPPASP